MSPEHLKSKITLKEIDAMPRHENGAMQWRKHILKTLQFMMHNSDFATLPTDQIRFVSSTYSKLIKTGGGRWVVEIPQLEIPILNEELSEHRPTLLIGGKIEGEGDEIVFSSFSVCITFTTESSNPVEPTKTSSYTRALNVTSCCLNLYRNKKRIVRRFHFDFQRDNHNIPTSHVQYGGKFPESEQYKECHYCLEHFLENPRFHYPPMDLVLLFDLIIREFKTPLKKWTQENDWRGLVFKSQELWWKDYWNKSAGYLNNPGIYTFHERIYGEADEP
jgi:hypothetical protein